MNWRQGSKGRHALLCYLLGRSPLMRCYLLRVGTCGQPDGTHVELMLSLSRSHCMCVPVCASSLSPVTTWDAVSLTVMQHGHKTWNIQVPASSSFDLYSHHFSSASCGRNKKSAVCLIGNRISLWASPTSSGNYCQSDSDSCWPSIGTLHKFQVAPFPDAQNKRNRSEMVNMSGEI